MKRFHAKNEKGFTLIEIIIVIAIIGILTAIAIPNYISYRDLGFCTSAESDANSIAGAVSDYFAIPNHTAIVLADLKAGGWKAISITGSNTFGLMATHPNTAITITVTDRSHRCPYSYMAAANTSVNPKGYWTPTSNMFTKVISP